MCTELVAWRDVFFPVWPGHGSYGRRSQAQCGSVKAERAALVPFEVQVFGRSISSWLSLEA